MIQYDLATGHRKMQSVTWSAQLLDHVLQTLGFSLRKPQAIAEAILWLSDHYNIMDQNPSTRRPPTPWEDPRTQVAYLCYFAPLNVCRLRALIWEGERLGFFKGLKQWLDLGAGPAPLYWALQGMNLNAQLTYLEPNPFARKLGQALAPELSLAPVGQHLKAGDFKGHLTVLSYVLNEDPSLIDLVMESEAVVIMEPATKFSWPRLHQTRSHLLANGFYIWAPCTHQGLCPMRPESRKHIDWCHDRVEPVLPPWFAEIQKCLPIKNHTLTYSYLLARRTPPPERYLARLVGDSLVEKGKTRQLLCQDSDRRFIRWRKKQKLSAELARGALVPQFNLTDETRDKVEIDATEAQNVPWHS